jgi:hypothetical protein
MRISVWTTLLLVALGIAPTAQAFDLLWDNNITSNGVGGRAVSPPAFPDIRIVNDFIVGDDPGWSLEVFRYGVVVDRGWIDGDITEVFIRENLGGNDPVGPEILSIGVGHSRMATGDNYFGRDYYIYSTDDLATVLGPGDYWIGLRHPNGAGTGTSYWMESDGGRDGAGTDPGYFSLDRGETWQPEDFNAQHAFEIRGRVIPEPGTALLFLGGVVVMMVRRPFAMPGERPKR